MDYLKLFADQERHGFPDLTGSEGQAVLRVSERILNAIITEQIKGSASIREPLPLLIGEEFQEIHACVG